jgi:predicted nucleotidyltransferase component of viral defense system
LSPAYKTPVAFRQALEARLRSRAREEGLDLQWLRRQVAFERLLARIFHRPDTVWLLKGGYAMELRLQQQARTTLDIDLMIADVEALRLVTTAEESEQTADLAFDHLQELASADLSDYFQYVIAKPKPITTAPEGGLRCSVESRIGGRRFANFHVDIGLGDLVLDEPEWVTGREHLEFAGITTARIPLLSSEQQIAEKLHTYTFPWKDRINTRVKDLVDLVLLFETQALDRNALREAIVAIFDHRNTHPVPEELPPPPEDWSDSFRALASELKLPVDTLREAFDYVEGRWDNLELGRKTS